VSGEEKNILYRADESSQGRANLESAMEGLFSFVLFESPFTSVSTVSRGQPTLVSLVLPGVAVYQKIVCVFLEKGGFSRVR
jgi:hypothetical protein